MSDEPQARDEAVTDKTEVFTGIDETLVLEQRLAPGERILNRYLLESLIGQGGMAVVWRARDEMLGDPVALKFLPSVVARDTVAVAELKEETRRARRLTHPNIVRIHDFVQDARLAAVSMEYVDGDTLANLRLAQPGKVFSAVTLAPLVTQLCAALEYAHTQGKLVHRDVKPANLLVTRNGQLKVADFGIARGLSEASVRLTTRAAGRTSGTVLYASPQQLMGEKPTEADDIYALGATLYELLTGKPPFFRGDAHSLIMQVREQPPAPMAERRKELDLSGEPIPPAWEKTIMACLAKRAEDRPKSAQEVVERLGLATGTERKTAMPTPAARTKWPIMVGVAAAALAIGTYALWPSKPAAPGKAVSPPAAADSKKTAVNSPTPTPPKSAPIAEVVAEKVAEPLAQPGELRVFSMPPDAEVTVNGRVLGKTPATLKNLPSGQPLQVQLKARGYRVTEQNVTLKSGEVRTLNVGTLTAAVSAIEFRKVPAGLTLDRAAVRIDGREIRPKRAGEGWRLDDLEPGTRVLEVTHPDYEPWKRTVSIADRETTEADLRPVPRPARLSLKVDGSLNYALMANGREVPIVEGVAMLPASESLTLEVRAPGFNSAARTLTAKPNGLENWEVKLAKPVLPKPGQPYENSLGMKFMPVPEISVLFSIWLTRAQDYLEFINETMRTWDIASAWRIPSHPAIGVTWGEAKAYCEWLTERELKAGRLMPGVRYRLPTDAEWSVAVGLGRETGKTPREKSGKIKGLYPWGTVWPPPAGAGNIADETAKEAKVSRITVFVDGYKDGFAGHSPVGSFTPNRFGLYDMCGNAVQMCEDLYDNSPIVQRVARGSSSRSGKQSELLSSYRSKIVPDAGNTSYGFRCVLDLGMAAKQ